MMSAKQLDADAKWNSMIDEAIPVFTGGLRGSDSFRQFLIQQAPQKNDPPSVVKEKKRLLRDNINGTSKAFFNKFKSDLKMQVKGETPSDDNAASSDDSDAVKWAKENPNDPRSAQIMKLQK